ncbi:unnamed protein product [Amaranthus hypochondriacus]
MTNHEAKDNLGNRPCQAVVEMELGLCSEDVMIKQGKEREFGLHDNKIREGENNECEGRVSSEHENGIPAIETIFSENVGRLNYGEELQGTGVVEDMGAQIVEENVQKDEELLTALDLTHGIFNGREGEVNICKLGYGVLGGEAVQCVDSQWLGRNEMQNFDSPPATPRQYVSESDLEGNVDHINLALAPHDGVGYKTTNNQDPLLYTLLNRDVSSPPAAVVDSSLLDEFVNSQHVSSSAQLQPDIRINETHSHIGGVIKSNGSAVSSKRPRGRPKKCIMQPLDSCVEIPLPNNASEAERTWSIAKLLGVSSSNEEAVLSELRKSKRLMLLGENKN